MATVFKAASLATHPLNPNPGTNAPFLVRIPFEVWCKDDNRQVNLMFRDRVQASTDNPFYAWNINNRNYAVIVNSPYDATKPIAATKDASNAPCYMGIGYVWNAFHGWRSGIHKIC